MIAASVLVGIFWAACILALALCRWAPHIGRAWYGTTDDVDYMAPWKDRAPGDLGDQS